MKIDFEDLIFVDIDEESKCMDGYNQKYRQLSKGLFRGHYRAAHLGEEFIIYFEQNNQVLEALSVTPENRCSVVFLMNEGVIAKLNGSAFKDDNLFICGPLSTFDTVGLDARPQLGAGVPGVDFVAVSIERDFFYMHVLGRNPDDAATALILKQGMLVENRDLVRSLRWNIGNAAEAIKNLSRINTTIASNARMSICDMLSKHLAILIPDSSAKIQAWPQPYRVIKRAREYLDENFQSDVSINKLAIELGASRRALEYYFRDQIGLSPAAYLKTVRLNEARSMLMLPEKSNMSIGDIAAQTGFWHPSRFAAYYREHFGKLPSETRL